MKSLHLYITVLSILLHLTHKAAGQAFNGTCEVQNATSKAAYTNWPFSVNCDHLSSIWEARTTNISNDILECIITQDDTVVPNEVIEVNSTNADTTYIAKLVINNTYCLTNEIQIDLRPFPEEGCKSIVNESKANDEVIFIESTIGDSVTLLCRPPEGKPEIIPKGADKSKFVTRWYVDCRNQKYRTNNLWQELEDPGYPNKLSMPRVDFYDAADFTCTVTYEDKLLYAVTYAQCIKQRTKSIKPTITCRNQETVALGEDADLNCNGQIVFGVTSSDDFAIEWFKNGKSICKNQFFNRTTLGYHDPRHSCITHGNNDSVVCVFDGENTPDDAIQKERKPLDMKLNIRNLIGSDFGDYSATIKYLDKTTNTWITDSWQIKLHEDNTPRLLRLIMILSICLGVLLFIIFLVLLYKKFEIYILVAYKRSWLWKCDRDDREYVCYLSYLYDTETLSDESLKATSTVVYAIQNLLEDLSYKYYDEQRQTDFTVQVERITNLVERCHRMVFVLTPEYLGDRWMRFHAELGFHGLLESQMGLIFILTPGSMKVLKKLARSDRVWNRLLIAVKTNRVIKWKEGMSDDELKKNIEYRLPKLNRRKVRALSDSDSGSINGLNPEYNRSLSQTTTHTIVSDDGAVVPEDQRL